MNFLLHHHFAVLELGSDGAGVGAMLPDLFRLAGHRLRAGDEPRASRRGAEPNARGSGSSSEETGLEDWPASTPIERPSLTDLEAGLVVAAGPLAATMARGIAHHFEADRWFHLGNVFREGEHDTGAALRALEAPPPKIGLFAHIIWEMCLDGALLRRVGLPQLLARMRAVAPRLDAHAMATLAAGARAGAPSAEHERVGARVAEVWDRVLGGGWLEAYCAGDTMCWPLEGMRTRFGLPLLEPQARIAVAHVLDARIAAAETMLDALTAEHASARRAAE